MNERSEIVAGSTDENCKAPGCPNKRGEGRFVGDVCWTCSTAQERLAKAAAEGGFTLGGVEHYNALTGNCAAAMAERANYLAQQLREAKK